MSKSATISNSLEDHKIVKANFTYSAAKVADLDEIATEFTLVTLVNDVSSSVQPYKVQMEETIQKIVEACQFSPRKDNLLFRFLQFSSSVSQTHGFKPLDNCKVDDYNDCLQVGGSTALFDATKNAIMATHDYATKLANQRFQVNGIVVVITDGCDNVSSCNASDVKAVLAQTIKDESLESIISILIGVGIEDQNTSQRLADFYKEGGLTQYVEQKNADTNTLKKLANFVSKSISAQSQALGTGSASVPLKF